jgi:putative tricarboxylic transport membrane protein
MRKEKGSEGLRLSPGGGPMAVTKQEEHPTVSLILMAVGLAIAVGSLGYGWGSFDSPGAGFLPFFSGAAMAGFSAITLLQSLRRGWSPLGEAWKGARWLRPAIATACLLLYSTFLRDLGFLVATVILMIYLYRMLEPSSWRVTLFAALATTLGFYLVFQTWLQAQLPRGLLGF